MSNTNRDYAIVYDVKNSSLMLNSPLVFYITDKNTSNIFVRLVTKTNIGSGVDQYTDIENASSYILIMRVIKPNDEVTNIKATQREPESIFEFDLTEDFKNIPGTYICELMISTMVNSKQELITSDSFTYEVKRSVLSKIDQIIEHQDTTIEKLLNELDATKAEVYSQVEEVKTDINNLNTAKNEINLQIEGTKNDINVAKAELSLQIEEVKNNSNYISVKNFNAQGDGATDDTKAIQDTIDFAIKNKLKVLIDEGTYKVSKLNVYASTVIEGISREKTILKIKDGSTEHFISINGTSIKNVELRNFTIDGNKNNVPTEITAIYTDQDTDTHHLFENLTIKNMSGNGIRLSRGENRLNDLYIHHCDRWGIGHLGSDNIFTNITCAWNYLGGVYEGGASSRWINCKSFVSGESDDTSKKPHKTSSGFKISGSRGVIMTNCEAQENYGHGFDISNYSSAIINGCRADCNGMINKYATSADDRTKLCGVSLATVTDSIIDITCDDFRLATGLTDLNWQYAGIVFANDNSKNNYINAKIVNNTETLLYTNWDNYVKTLKSDYKNTIIINGVEVSDKSINSKLNLIEDRFDTARLDIGDAYKENNNCWRIIKETDGSLRVRLMVNKSQVNDQLQFNKSGLVVGANNTMLGFYGKAPVIQEAIVGEATDLESAVRLANSIRYILKNIGLCK